MTGDVSTIADQPVGRRVVLGPPQLDPARTRRLAELGLRAGTEVLVLHRTAGRGRVLAVGETRIALDRATLEAMPVGCPREDTPEVTAEDALEESDR
ncbi:MAG TPA: FeoA domain-containing protein [Dermatophilaceae bacterium]|nr:FeoA domain-containing protein [Dermatophilaceae bacterium]